VIEALTNATFEAVVSGATTGLVGTITFEIFDPTDDSVILAPTTTGITELAGHPGTYVKNHALATPGTFVVRWTYTDDIVYTADEELVIRIADLEDQATPGGVDPAAGEASITPSVEQVALLLRTRTVGLSSGGLGGDTGPSDVTTFTATTRPTASEVEDLIDMAVGVVTGPLGGSGNIAEHRQRQVRYAVALYAAMLVETSFFREQSTAESRRNWMELYANALEGIEDEADDLGGNFGFGTLYVGTTRYAVESDAVDSIQDTPAGT
jgi:hypothetical protein